MQVLAKFDCQLTDYMFVNFTILNFKILSNSLSMPLQISYSQIYPSNTDTNPALKEFQTKSFLHTHSTPFYIVDYNISIYTNLVRHAAWQVGNDPDTYSILSSRK